jgi:hypothetical protein
MIVIVSGFRIIKKTTKGGEIMTRSNLQIRASEAEKELAKTLADDYGTSVSDLIRMALVYVDANRPKLTLTIELEGKAAA